MKSFGQTQFLYKMYSRENLLQINATFFFSVSTYYISTLCTLWDKEVRGLQLCFLHQFFLNFTFTYFCSILWKAMQKFLLYHACPLSLFLITSIIWRTFQFTRYDSCNSLFWKIYYIFCSINWHHLCTASLFIWS